MKFILLIISASFVFLSSGCSVLFDQPDDNVYYITRKQKPHDIKQT